MSWRLNIGFPWLASTPTVLPWVLAGWLKRDERRIHYLIQRQLTDCFKRVFPQATDADCQSWAVRHLDMLAHEMVDALAFHRLGMRAGPSIEFSGLDVARDFRKNGQGFILVLNHYDRLLTAPVALAKRGVPSNVLTMPVIDNPDLSVAQRGFLLKKIKGYTAVTGGQWRTTAQPLRQVHDSLRQGGVWVILADAWRPEFTRLRSHAFLGGTLMLPTGIERLAESTGVPMIHAVTSSLGPARLSVQLECLPTTPKAAVDAVVQRLATDVTKHPWAWWQWGQLDQMWTKTSGDAN